MPVADSKQDDSSHDSSREERDKDKDRGDRANKQKASSGKTKDLSHVPCKFFKVGSCTAGASCPFSHAVLEPGQAKEICAWFVKGNCKFGHKCALAHVLPGQNMSMDRKNKKAAQAAANAANQNHSSPRDSHRGGRSRGNNHNSSQSAGNRNSLLSGSTAPTRSLSSSRGSMPMPLRSTLSPSAPAPPVKDTDFSSFGLPDESNKLPNAPAQAKSTSSVDLTDSSPPPETDVSPDPPKPQEQPQEASKSPPPLPLSTPRRNPQSDRSSPSVPDFGPIGSPPRASSSSRVSRSNGLSPGTSPHNAPISSSPFSAPTTQTSFAIHDQLEATNDFKAMSGLSASLGAMMSWDRKPASRLRNGNTLSGEIVVEDEDLEEFIPGSLSELLTPEERSRRLSRTAATRPSIAVADGDIPASQLQAGLQQGYSRSVPAPSLLQDIRSIWSDNAPGIPGSPDTSGLVAGPTITGGGLGNGTPSSFQSNSGFNSRLDEMLAPSNASAAFLPGLHHYINKPGARVAGAQSLYPTATSASGQHLSGAYSAGLGGMALSPPRISSYTSRLDAGPPDPFLSQTRRPIPGSADPFTSEQDERRSALSPSTRALQSHAPGQSLPQGLAAGYSRIHALPPLPSPSTPSAFSPGRNLVGYSPGTKTLGHVSSLSGEWHSVSPGAPNAADPATLSTSGNQAALAGLETMFSRLSYSAAASRPSGPPPGLVARNPSGRSYNSGQQGPLSPLSRPVPTDDDELFFSMDSMDG